MKHLDLFSGIGGFALAADIVFGNVEHTFCDNDPFCQEVLKKHWPKAKIYGDIRTLTNRSGEGLERSTRESVQWRSEGFTRDTFILTGGFPCQPFSQAGRRKGTEDDRYLWPEMLRVIREFKPTWVIAENVRGLITQGGGVVFEQVCLDLEGEGYDVQPLVIPAVAVNAPHRRDRVWIVANRAGERPYDRKCDREERPILHDEGTPEKDKREREGRERRSGETDNVTESFSKRTRWSMEGNGNSDAPDTGCERQEVIQKQAAGGFQRDSWNKNWIEVATEFCSVDDGLPVKLDGFECTKSQHRVQQLKAYGNAIVPQVAIQIMKSIANNP